MLKLWPEEVEGKHYTLLLSAGGHPVVGARAHAAAAGPRCTAEGHVPPAWVSWPLCKDRRGEDLVLRTVKGSCRDYGLPEAQAWVKGSKSWCQVGEMGQITGSERKDPTPQV